MFAEVQARHRDSLEQVAVMEEMRKIHIQYVFRKGRANRNANELAMGCEERRIKKNFSVFALSAILSLVFSEVGKTRQKIGLLKLESSISANLSLRYAKNKQVKRSNGQFHVGMGS